MNICASGHGSHAKVRLVAKALDMSLLLDVFDYERYKDVEGYCTGKDDISRTLELYQTWEPDETRVVSKLLLMGDPKRAVMLDFGTHIGWYSLIAGKLGYSVFGYEADAENLSTLMSNAELNEIPAKKICVALAWVDVGFAENKLPRDAKVRFMKCDIEGKEKFAVEACRGLFERHNIDYALIEITPAFNDSYPAMVEFIKSCGYKAFVIGPYEEGARWKEFDGNYDFGQINLLFQSPEVVA